MDDARQIENLLYLYAEKIDAGDFAGVAALFRDADIVAPAHNSVVSGEEAVLAMYQQSTRLYADSNTPKTRHLISNVIIEHSPDAVSATARSCYTVLQATDALALQPIISGRYRDELCKRDGVWGFARREMHVDLVGDLSQHLLFEL